MSSIWDFVGKHLKGAVTSGLSYLNDGLSDEDIDPMHMFTKNDAEKMAEDQWKWQQQKYDENYWMQVRNIQYQQYLNALQMQREDTAVSRRVADLKASGLSPTLAAGSAADSGAMHAGQAPQYEVGVNPKLEAAMFKQSMTKDMIELASSVMGNVANIARTGAETQFLKAQTDKIVGETPLDLKLKEMDQILKESTLSYEITLKAQQTDLNELRKINDELTGKILSNEVAIKAYEIQIKEHESKIKEIEARYAEREHKAGLGKTEAEKDKLVQEVKEKAVAVEMAEFLRDKVKESGVPLEMMSPAFKNYMSFYYHGKKAASVPVSGAGGVPFKDTKAGKFLSKVFVKSPGLAALKAAAQSR